MERYKYPRTPHLPGSGSFSADDIHVAEMLFASEHVAVTEKLDGECTTIYKDGCHARSIDSSDHPSRSYVKQLAAVIGSHLPNGMRICGENLYARHSVAYENLENYFYVFNIWEGDMCLSWEETVTWAGLFDLPVVPVLYQGPMCDEAELKRLWEEKTGGATVSEGFVVRTSHSFAMGSFSQNVAKWVRPNHVQTSEHWMHQAVVANGLKNKAQ